MSNAAPCLTCRRAACAGVCTCTVTGKAIAEQIATGVCPHPDGSRFADRGLGDTVARVLDAAGVGPVAKRVITAVTGRPCGCEGRRARLNKLVPYTSLLDRTQ